MTTKFAFLFGAGASKALGIHVKPRTPPLMCELYDELAIFFQKERESGGLFGIYPINLGKIWSSTPINLRKISRRLILNSF